MSQTLVIKIVFWDFCLITSLRLLNVILIHIKHLSSMLYDEYLKYFLNISHRVSLRKPLRQSLNPEAS